MAARLDDGYVHRGYGWFDTRYLEKESVVSHVKLLVAFADTSPSVLLHSSL